MLVYQRVPGDMKQIETTKMGYNYYKEMILMTYERVSEGSMTVHDCKRAARPNPLIGNDLKWPTPGTMIVD